MTKDIKGTTLEHLTEKRVRALMKKNMKHQYNIMEIFRLCKQHGLKIERTTAFDIYNKASYYSRKAIRLADWLNVKFNDGYKGKWHEDSFLINRKYSEDDFTTWMKIFKWEDIIR